MFKRKTGLSTYIRLFISTIIVMITMNILTAVFLILCNTYLKTTYIIDYSQLEITHIIPASLLVSLFTLSNYRYATKAIRIENKSMYEGLILDAMENMKWTIIEQNEASMVFISPLNIGIFKQKIIINFTEYEIYITGPRKYLEIFISNAKFPYGAYEISNPKE